MRTPAQPRVNLYGQAAPPPRGRDRIVGRSFGDRGAAPTREEPLEPRCAETKQAGSPIKGEAMSEATSWKAAYRQSSDAMAGGAWEARP